METRYTLPTILAYALDRGYTADCAVEDLTRLMNQATLVEMEHGTDLQEYRKKSILEFDRLDKVIIYG